MMGNAEKGAGRTQKIITPRLIIEAVCRLWEKEGDVNTETNPSGQKRYIEFKSEWSDNTSTFRVTSRKKSNFGLYLQTLSHYSKKDPTIDENRWLYTGKPQYGEAIFFLRELGLATINEQNETRIETGSRKKGGGGQSSASFVFTLGPFRSPDVDDCLSLYEEALSEGWNPEARENSTAAAPPKNLLHNFPPAPQGSFVGELRAADLNAIHKRITTTGDPLAITGMGGLGKTILAREYALTYADNYPGGRCWVNAKDGEYNPSAEARDADKVYRISQIIAFARRLQILTDINLPIENQLEQVWEQIGDTGTLFIFDDVKNGFQFENLLPRQAKQREHITFIGTSRMSELGTGIELYPLEIPPIEDALTQLQAIAGVERIEAERETANTILGADIMDRLPLAIRLLGCYLRVKKKEKLTETSQRLIDARESWEPGGDSYIGDDALEDIAQLTNAQRGARAIFELTWGWLQTSTHKTAKLLPLFSASFVDWGVVKAALDKGYETLQDDDFSPNSQAQSEGELILHSLISEVDYRVRNGTPYIYHPLIGDFIKSKTKAIDKTTWLTFVENEAIKFHVPHLPKISSLTPVNIFEYFNRSIKLSEIALSRLELFDSAVGLNPFIGSLCEYYLRTFNKEKAIKTIKEVLQSERDKLHKISSNRFLGILNSAFDLFFQINLLEEAEEVCKEAFSIELSIYSDSTDAVDKAYYQTLQQTVKTRGWNIEGQVYSFEDVAHERLLRRKDNLIGTHLTNLANLYNKEYNYQMYLETIEAVVNIKTIVFGNENVSKKFQLTYLARALTKNTRYLEAETILEKIYKEDIEKRSDLRIPPAIELAMVRVHLKKFSEAEELMLDIISWGEANLEENNHSLAECYNKIAVIYRSINQNEKAVPYLKKQIETLQDIDGVNSLSVAEAVNSLAGAYMGLENFKEAESLILQSLRIRTERLGNHHPNTIASKVKLGLLHSLKGEFDIAETIYSEIVQTKKVQSEHDKEQIAGVLSMIAANYLSQDKFSEAASYSEQSLEISEYENDSRLMTLRGLRTARLHMRQVDKALLCSEKIVALSKKLYGVKHPGLLSDIYHLGLAYELSGRIDEAESVLYEAVVTCTNNGTGYIRPSQEHYLKLLSVGVQLASVYIKQGRLDEAEDCLNDVLPQLKANLPGNDYRVHQAVTLLNQVKEAMSATSSTNPSDSENFLSSILARASTVAVGIRKSIFSAD